jgi:hypothetical protein|uniref:hypothetical protein n=1 Tax=Polaribacter sp. TaxID=1920175 RepID=UPI004048765C
MKNWKKEGFFWAIWMFVILEFIKPVILGEALRIDILLIGIPFYLFAGFFMALAMRYFSKNKN